MSEIKESMVTRVAEAIYQQRVSEARDVVEAMDFDIDDMDELFLELRNESEPSSGTDILHLSR